MKGKKVFVSLMLVFILCSSGFSLISFAISTNKNKLKETNESIKKQFNLVEEEPTYYAIIIGIEQYKNNI
ncbi:MAG: hypothetical protein KGY67_05045 [Candidatus Thermoplasmatota archaeon]|nr:hypothetical protein [Candidatus Thermoplasmatota archaeon]